ncbi:hypothetical protein PSEWESI4_03962 [Pseudomonas carbonaria]|uniref:Uncharacterized protein n=1 Tax=Zestomonas carbonaria TaxID=2762745 RepID=A0A7U7IB85_9GAMM|nr:hypothetical protein PSEWESI4_03962 [Pseudomonas carbonaria]
MAAKSIAGMARSYGESGAFRFRVHSPPGPPVGAAHGREKQSREWPATGE